MAVNIEHVSYKTHFSGKRVWVVVTKEQNYSSSAAMAHCMRSNVWS